MPITYNGNGSKTKQFLAIIYMLTLTIYIGVEKLVPKKDSSFDNSILRSQVFLNTNRITILETEMKSVKDAVNQNRLENREEHNKITGKLDDIILSQTAISKRVGPIR
jgi:hypothetical protein